MTDEQDKGMSAEEAVAILAKTLAGYRVKEINTTAGVSEIPIADIGVVERHFDGTKVITITAFKEP